MINNVDTGKKLELNIYAGNHKIKITVNAQDSIDDLKNVLKRETGIKVSDLKLKFKGERLNCGTLQTVGIGDGSSIFIERVLDLQLCFIGQDEKIVKETPPRLFLVVSSWKVSKLNKMIHRKIGLEMTNKVCVYEGCQLVLDKTFEENGVKRGSTVFVKNNMWGGASHIRDIECSKLLC